MKGKNYQEIYARCGEMVGDGVIPGCREIASRGVCADGCCFEGAFLLEGEFLNVVPDGVQVFQRRVRNCLGESGCKFPPNSKPLICKMAPVVMVMTGLDLSRIVLFDGERFPDGSVLNSGCSAGIPDVFRKRVFRVIGFLKENGIWTRSRSKLVLPQATPEEYHVFAAAVAKSLGD